MYILQNDSDMFDSLWTDDDKEGLIRQAEMNCGSNNPETWITDMDKDVEIARFVYINGSVERVL